MGMTKLMRALWTTLQVSKTAALMVFSTDKLNSLNSMVSTTDSIAAPPMAVSDISAPKTPTKRAANTVNATFTSLTSRAAPMDSAVLTILTTTVLFTVASVLSAVDTDTVATLLAAATVDTEDHTTEKISFNPFKEVFKADKLLL